MFRDYADWKNPFMYSVPPNAGVADSALVDSVEEALNSDSGTELMRGYFITRRIPEIANLTSQCWERTVSPACPRFGAIATVDRHS